MNDLIGLEASIFDLEGIGRADHLLDSHLALSDDGSDHLICSLAHHTDLGDALCLSDQVGAEVAIKILDLLRHLYRDLEQDLDSQDHERAKCLNRFLFDFLLEVLHPLRLQHHVFDVEAPEYLLKELEVLVLVLAEVLGRHATYMRCKALIRRGLLLSLTHFLRDLRHQQLYRVHE